MATVARPLLIVIGGKPGSGKTTLARPLAEADALGLPLLQRDAIKAGLMASHGIETPAARAVVVPRSFDLFFRTIELWLRAGVSLIAEHSLDRRWHEEPVRGLLPLARTVVLHCDVPDAVAARRFIAREGTPADTATGERRATVERMRAGTYDWRKFDPFDLGVPGMRVETSDGYDPNLAAILAFCQDNRAGSTRPGQSPEGRMREPPPPAPP